MKTFGSKRMGWVAATLALLALSLALATPKVKCQHHFLPFPPLIPPICGFLGSSAIARGYVASTGTRGQRGRLLACLILYGPTCRVSRLSRADNCSVHGTQVVPSFPRTICRWKGGRNLQISISILILHPVWPSEMRDARCEMHACYNVHVYEYS